MATAKNISKQSINLKDIADQAALSAEMMDQVRAAMLNPTSRKKELSIHLSQLATYCGVEKGSIIHRMAKGDLPQGNLNTTGSRREFTLKEARTWICSYRKDRLRPKERRPSQFQSPISKVVQQDNHGNDLGSRPFLAWTQSAHDRHGPAGIAHNSFWHPARYGSIRRRHDPPFGVRRRDFNSLRNP